jgi:hypothetical protein
MARTKDMARTKAETEKFIFMLRLRGDPFGIERDLETQEILLDAALVRFFEKYKHMKDCGCRDEAQHAAVRGVRHELVRYFRSEKHRDDCNCSDAEMHEISHVLDARLALWESSGRSDQR